MRKLTMFITAICVLFLIEKIKASIKNDEFLLLFAVLLVLFATFELFSNTLLPLFSLCQDKMKNGTLHAYYVTRN